MVSDKYMKDNYDDHKPQSVGVELPSKLDEPISRQQENGLDRIIKDRLAFNDDWLKQAINQYISEIIGKDEKEHPILESNPNAPARNQLRTEQRKKAGL